MTSRTMDVLRSKEVPRHENGGIAVCHPHQRVIVLAGGLNAYLEKMLRRSANEKAAITGKCPKCGTYGGYRIAHRSSLFLCRNQECRSKWGRKRKFGNLSEDVNGRLMRLLEMGLDNWEITEATGMRGATINRRRAVLAESRSRSMTAPPKPKPSTGT